MNIMGAFIAGFLVGELLQFGAWGMGHPGHNPLGYFKESWWHWCLNLSAVTVVGVLWWSEMLGPLLGHLGFTPIAQLLSVSPPFGFLLAFATDIIGDKLSFGFLTYLSKKVPSVSRETIPPKGDDSGKNLPGPQAPQEA